MPAAKHAVEPPVSDLVATLFEGSGDAAAVVDTGKRFGGVAAKQAIEALARNHRTAVVLRPRADLHGGGARDEGVAERLVHALQVRQVTFVSFTSKLVWVAPETGSGVSAALG